jgi:uncharacterized Zn finger protein
VTNFSVEKQEWWVERWLELLSSYRFKKRLERGRNYAREGNVLSIEFDEAKAIALVQGSEAEPYRVSLSLDAFSNEDWDFAIATMSDKAIFSAQLLAGELPENIEAVFTASGLSLFPFSLGEVRSRCSCPDKANPCKHIAAVYYQLADRFSEDPFVIFQLRGRTREQILDRLRQIRSQQATGDATESDGQAPIIASKTKTAKTSPDNYHAFWQYDEPLESSLVAIAPVSESKTILDLLGRIPLPPADADALQQYLSQTYQTSSQQAIMSALNR